MFFLVENQPIQPPPSPSGKFHYFFFWNLPLETDKKSVLNGRVQPTFIFSFPLVWLCFAGAYNGLNWLGPVIIKTFSSYLVWIYFNSLKISHFWSWLCSKLNSKVLFNISSMKIFLLELLLWIHIIVYHVKSIYVMWSVRHQFQKRLVEKNVNLST